MQCEREKLGVKRREDRARSLHAVESDPPPSMEISSEEEAGSWPQLAPISLHVRHLSALCEDHWKSRPFTVCLGPLQVFPPLPATEKGRGKCYNVFLAMVRIAKKKKREHDSMNKEDTFPGLLIVKSSIYSRISPNICWA